MESELFNHATTKRKRSPSLSVSNIGDSLSSPTSPIDIVPQAADSEQENFSCSMCGHRPAGDPKWHRGNLAKHMRIHDNNEKYSCQYPGCEKSYTRSDNLGHHIKVHHSGNKRLRDPRYSSHCTEPFGKLSVSNHDEDTSALHFDYPGQYAQTGPISEYAQSQTYHMPPGEGRWFG
jgi:uncharacterized Zn-finger protein